MEDQANKPHRKAKEKKKFTGQNPKAFTVSNPGKLLKQARRSHDIKEKRFHVPLVDRLPDEPPPRIVTIVGPPGVGKTTLLRSLIRRYAKETMQEPQGPITVVTSKKQRLTFIECPNELEAMVDIAKITDIILLMIDGNYGMEMETFEFLNILSATGMPGNVFGVLTHLDLFRKPQALKDAKKRIKHRLWSELYQGAHLFYLSGIINGRYPDREVLNLSRFLAVMKKPRPLVWRNSHCYSLVDSFRDQTHPTKVEEDEKCDRTVSLSGYLRGTNFSTQGQRVHIPGLGDFTVSHMELLPDPCPTPAMDKAREMATGKKGRRRLDEKEKKIHAPMSDRSGLKIDGDEIYIYREKGFTLDKDAEGVERGEGEEMIMGLQGERRLLGQTEDGVQLFSGGGQIKALPEEEDSGRKTQRKARIVEREDDSGDEDPLEDEGFVSGEEEEEGDDAETEFSEAKLGKMFRPKKDQSNGTDDIAFADSDSDLGSFSEDELDDEAEDGEEESDEEGAFRWKENMADRAQSLHGKKRKFEARDLARMLYDESIPIDDVARRWGGTVEEEEEDIEDEDEGDAFFKKAKHELPQAQTEDRSIPVFNYDELAAKWSEDAIEALRERFTSMDLKRGAEDADGDDDDDDESGFGDEDDEEGDGAFEDLETGEQHGPEEAQPEEDGEEQYEDEREKNARRKEELKLRFEEEDREGFRNPKAIARQEGGNADEFGEDDWYEAQKALLTKQQDINKAEYENLDDRQRMAVEGFKAGIYAKMVIEGVPAEFFERFDSKMPLIVGGLAPTEDRFGYVQARVKKHRWHKRILKTSDPLILSLGWRRFQTMPIYSLYAERTRHRMLKYTPEHTACDGTFYGPLIAPNTGFVAFQSFSSANPGFRIAATGTIQSVDESIEIVKKLKLTGTPAKVFKNTAFIKGMFQSGIEIAKFEGAAIKTVSGIRGQIKRALSKPEGQFRATFEDKVLLSDIVFLRAWYPIKPHRLYNPSLNILGWSPMRLTGEVRRDENIPTPQNRNSQYRVIERQTRHFNPLRVPRKLAADLPFKSQIVQSKPRSKKTYMQKRAVVLGGEERKARDLMQKLTTIRKDVAEKRAKKKGEKREVYKKRLEEGEERRLSRERSDKKEFWRGEGKKRKAQEEGGGKRKRR